MKSLAALALATALLAAPLSVQAEQAVKYGNIEIHYNAMPTDELAPAVAKNYNIERSRNRALLTISVLRKNKFGVAEPVAAVLQAHAVNLNEQRVEIPMREIREGAAVYYLGELRVSPPDTLKFTVAARPIGENRDYQAEFTRPFFK